MGPTTSQLLDKVLLLILFVLKDEDEEALMDNEGLVFLRVFDEDDKGVFGYKSDGEDDV